MWHQTSIHRRLEAGLLALAVACGWILPCGSTQAQATEFAAQAELSDAEALHEQAVRLYRQGKYAEAIELATRVLAIREKALGPEHLVTAMSLNNLAGMYFSIAAYGKAEPLYTRALAISEKVLGPEDPDSATVQNNLALVYAAVGAYAKAEALFKHALTVHLTILGREDPRSASTMTNLGDLYRRMGAPGEAEPLLADALAILEKIQGPEHPETAKALNNLAVLYDSMGAYAKAEPLYMRALATSENANGPWHPQTASSLNNLAVLYVSTGAYAKAKPLYVRALGIHEVALGPQHPRIAVSLNNLAQLFRAMGAYAEAVPFATRALEIREATLGDNHPDTALNLNSLAGLYVHIGAYAKAEPLYRRAQAINEKALGHEHPLTAQSLNNLAVLYYSMGAYAKAEPLNTRALSIYDKALGPEHPATARSQQNLATLNWNQGDLTKAQQLLSSARRITEINASRVLLTGSEQRRRQYLGTLTIAADVSFSLADPSDAARALGAAAVLQSKGRTLDATADSVARLRQHLDEPGRALLDELDDVVAQRAKLGLDGPGAGPIEAFRQRMSELAADRERLESDLSSRSAEFQQAIQPITLERVQQALGAKDVLIEWIRFSPFNPKARGEQDRWGAAHYAAYLITREKPPLVVDLGDAAAIERAVVQWQSQLRTPGSDPRPPEARSVFERVMQPLLAPLAQLQANPTRLLLSPDGALNLIPFAALIDGQGRHLGQRYELSYLTSGRDLLRLQTEPAPAREGVTVIAAPAYGDGVAGEAAAPRGGLQTLRSMDFERSGLRFGALPGTAGEARLLRQLFKLDDAHVLTGTTATEARVKHLQGPRILHIATHGFFLQDQVSSPAASRGTVESVDIAVAPRPVGENALLRSGLALAGANVRASAENEDGILTAAEAARLDLQGTQLVVLSACETGQGDVAHGEGVYGLRRALVLAGAQSQLVSLWKVGDAATEALMGEYYRRLAQGEGRAQALRSAQQVMQSNPATAHPYYWAAFVPIGDWRAVE